MKQVLLPCRLTRLVASSGLACTVSKVADTRGREGEDLVAYVLPTSSGYRAASVRGGLTKWANEALERANSTYRLRHFLPPPLISICSMRFIFPFPPFPPSAVLCVGLRDSTLRR